MQAAAAAVTSSAAAATASTPGAANAIVRPTPIAVGGRPSIANTTNIDTLLNARSKVKSLKYKTNSFIQDNLKSLAPKTYTLK